MATQGRTEGHETQEEAIGKKQRRPAENVVVCQPGRSDLAEQIRETLAHRACEIFERRGRMHGHDLEDWWQAESEILRELPSEINESPEHILVRIELTGLDPTTLQVGVEPRRVVLRGRIPLSDVGEFGALGNNGNGGETVGFLDLPNEVEAPKAKAVIKGAFLEVVAEKRRT